MKNHYVKFTIMFFLFGLIAKAQNGVLGSITINLDEIAVMDLADTNGSGMSPINLQLDSQTIEAGDGSLPFSSSNTKSINYTVSIANGNTKAIMISAIGPDDLLSVTLTPTTSFGGGQLGNITTTGLIPLSSTPTKVVENIGSCYTGDGALRGPSLAFYIASANNFSDLTASSQVYTITYTMVDE